MLRDMPSLSRSASWLSRRLTIRYPSGLGADTGLASDGVACRRVKVHDISKGGIALLLRRPLEIGKEVLIQISNRPLRFSFDLGAVVRHATPFTRGRWIVGLQFHQELTGEELANLT
ncbi:MAG: PilZ domain-containing protein [Gemmataceae bacterium]